MERVCVYCGSSPGRGDDYRALARATGSAVAARGLGLVYGGAGVGLMGALADAALAGGAPVTGVIPGVVREREVAHRGLTELVPVDSMHERKRLMAERADAFVALPGGLGTLEELFEILTWAQLGIHAKPIGLVNGLGYFDGLLAFLDHCQGEGLLNPDHRALLHADADPGRLLDRLLGRHAPA